MGDITPGNGAGAVARTDTDAVPKAAGTGASAKTGGLFVTKDGTPDGVGAGAAGAL